MWPPGSVPIVAPISRIVVERVPPVAFKLMGASCAFAVPDPRALALRIDRTVKPPETAFDAVKVAVPVFAPLTINSPLKTLVGPV